MRSREPLHFAIAFVAAFCWALLLGMLFLNCAHPVPPGPPILSPAVNVDDLLPPPPPPVVVPDNVSRFPDMPVGTGRCPGLPAGILVSEAAYAEDTRIIQERDRLRAEVGVMHKLRRDERAGCESLLQSQRLEMVLISREASQARRWANVKLALGIGLGLAVGFAAGRYAR